MPEVRGIWRSMRQGAGHKSPGHKCPGYRFSKTPEGASDCSPNRLKTVGYGDGENQAYTFDAMGTRTAKTDNVTGNKSYTFDNANRLVTRQVGSSPVANYTSDADGNTLTDGYRTNTWDSQNRLISCATSGTGAQTSTFVYGADGLRRKFTVTNNGQSTPASITHFGYDASNVVREWGENLTSDADLPGLGAIFEGRMIHTALGSFFNRVDALSTSLLLPSGLRSVFLGPRNHRVVRR